MKSDGLDRFVTVEFKRFKAFESFRLDLRAFNVLVGPNNAGKSTVIAAFRILSEAMRKASSRKAEIIQGPTSRLYGHNIDLRGAFVAEENLFFDYHDDEAAFIKFTLYSGNTLTLYFSGARHMLPHSGRSGQELLDSRYVQQQLQMQNWLRSYPQSGRSQRTTLPT